MYKQRRLEDGLTWMRVLPQDRDGKNIKMAVFANFDEHAEGLATGSGGRYLYYSAKWFSVQCKNAFLFPGSDLTIGGAVGAQ
ncbi:MAG TPA: hypothetical protein VIF60_18590 [Burkholderiaceae bacterium]|jgi:hypothetical protein